MASFLGIGSIGRLLHRLCGHTLRNERFLFLSGPTLLRVADTKDVPPPAFAQGTPRAARKAALQKTQSAGALLRRVMPASRWRVAPFGAS
jgi:hypothetical protein